MQVHAAPTGDSADVLLMKAKQVWPRAMCSVCVCVCVCRLSLAYDCIGNLRRIVNRSVQALAKGDVAAAVSCVEKLNVRACVVAKRAPSCC
jgi:hypothetical protein